MSKTINGYFICPAGFFLLVIGLVMLISQSSYMGLIQPRDPIFLIPTSVGLFISGSCAIIAGVICLFGKVMRFKLLLILWLVVNYMAYRAGIFFLCGPALFYGYCSGLAETFELPFKTVYLALTTVTTFLLIGSVVSLLCLWVDKINIKTVCAVCGGHIQLSQRMVGHLIPCPHCQNEITLRKCDETFKVSCYFCHEHIEFPMHALGQKISCPHCKMSITLKEPT